MKKRLSEKISNSILSDLLMPEIVIGKYKSRTSTLLQAVRLPQNPIIKPEMPGLEGKRGRNINGPTLIRVPDWIKNPLGQYYLYFAHHRGQYIRLAYADQIEGPWSIYEPGTLHLNQTDCSDHIASPDAHINQDTQEIDLYFHGIYPGKGQITMLAKSKDGLHFTASNHILGPFYFRVFQYNGMHYAVAKKGNWGGVLLRSQDGITPFEVGSDFIPRLRHAALWRQGNQLLVVYSRMGDKPECLIINRIDLTQPWENWAPLEPARVLLTPEEGYEGADLPLQPSVAGPAKSPVRQLRDPAIFVDTGKTYLLYSVAGEQGIAVAELMTLGHQN